MFQLDVHHDSGAIEGGITASRYFDPHLFPRRAGGELVRGVSAGRRLSTLRAGSGFSDPILHPYTEDCDFVIQTVIERYFPRRVAGYGLQHVLQVFDVINRVRQQEVRSADEAGFLLGQQVPDHLQTGAIRLLRAGMRINNVRYAGAPRGEALDDVQFPDELPDREVEQLIGGPIAPPPAADNFVAAFDGLVPNPVPTFAEVAARAEERRRVQTWHYVNSNASTNLAWRNP